jgi:hypothetical protein
MYTNHWGATVGLDLAALGGSSTGRLVDGEITSDRPLGAADALGSLVELGRHIEVVDRRGLAVLAIEADQRVDLEVRKVEVDIDRVETSEEVDQGLLFLLRHVSEQGRLDGIPGGEGLSDREGKRECLGVDVANVYTTLVGEQDPIALTFRGDADVELGMGRVRQERLNNEVVECASDAFDLRYNNISNLDRTSK